MLAATSAAATAVGVVGLERLRGCSTRLFDEERVPVAATGCAPCRATTASTRSTIDIDGSTRERSTTSRPSPRPACSAATPTGAARSGSPSTTSSINALERYAPLSSATTSRSSTRPVPGSSCTLSEVADDLRDRLISLFLVGAGRPPAGFGWVDRFQHDPAWKDNMLFFEYFHGDNGAGLGACHQTGWTGLVADLISARGGRPGSVEAGATDDRVRPAGLRCARRGGAREWLVTDGLGGYAMGTVAGLRTRRYHGLLVVAVDGPAARDARARRARPRRSSSATAAFASPPTSGPAAPSTRPATCISTPSRSTTACRAGAGRSATSCSSARSRWRTDGPRSSSCTAWWPPPARPARGHAAVHVARRPRRAPRRPAPPTARPVATGSCSRAPTGSRGAGLAARRRVVPGRRRARGGRARARPTARTCGPPGTFAADARARRVARP